MKTSRLIASFVVVLLVFSVISCKYDSKGKNTVLPNVTGSASELIVVLDKAVWEEPIGKTYTEILKDDYPMIPQPEPVFDVVLVSPANFSGIFQTHRNIIVTNVSSGNQKAQIVVQRDVWATPQIVVNVVGPTYPAIAEMLLTEKDRLIQLIEQAERDRVVTNATKYEEEGLRLLLEKKFGVSMTFPKGYRLNKDTTDFVWISHETPHTSQAILIYSYPYTEKNTFSAEYLIEKRNHFVNKLIPGPTTGSYMTTFTEIPPEYSPIQYKDRYFGRLRGLWDVHAHAMGGPFISLTTIDEANQRVITVEGYVYAPRFKKRNYLRQVEALLYTFSLIEK